MVLTEGSASGIVIGVAFVAAGALFAYFRRAPSMAGIWTALALVAVGVVVILFASSITVTANKPGGQLSYQKKRLIGAQNTTYPIADILRIETRRQWRTET